MCFSDNGDSSISREQNLLVYSSVLTQSGTVAQIGPMSVQSDGSLTDPISPVTLVTPGNWVVTDP